MYEYTDFNEFNSLNNYYNLQICENISFNKNKLYTQSFLYMKKNLISCKTCYNSSLYFPFSYGKSLNNYFKSLLSL